MSPKTQEFSQLPKTGRIGRFAKILQQETSNTVVFRIMKDAHVYTSTSNNRIKASWIKGAIKRLEIELGAENGQKIMESCGRMCCGTTTRKRVKTLMGESNNIPEFLEKLNKNGIGGGRLLLKDAHTITGGYNKCYCGQVKQTEEKFLTKTYCYCSIGWYKQLFETALYQSVDIELVQSIISGAKTCEFIIHF
ncbi:MAG: hypothetical protein EAX86_09295 [Candidatus Heimdallarchaeota archaeon]|nr:hypothetical protein [Candidatus Heimdallarchaeota archaeon]